MDILFEIGTEELPATALADIFESAAISPSGNKETVLETKFKKAFEDARVAFSACEVFATPRRLVFFLQGAAEFQTAQENLLKGPSKQDAYGPDGQPTEKLLGFLKARKALPQDVILSMNQGREYVYVKQKESVQKTQKVLPSILDLFVRSLSFPKMMHWDDSGIHFPRPIRSFLCLCEKKVPPFKIGSLWVSNKTTFFEKSGRKTVVVKSIPAYFQLFKKKGIPLDPAERKNRIREKLEVLARSLKAKLYNDPFLLNEVNFLVECPDLIQALFHEEFLKLPLEVLTVSMARKQRIFGLLDKESRVIPKFLGVLDGRATASEKKRISTNYEHILHAKLQDSLFFYNEDMKVGLEKRREELKDLIFLKGAGSMLEKSERLVSLAKAVGPEAGLSKEEQKTLERAARLCKADLLTQMVGEFPELQGIMGKYYALAAGEPCEVGLAIGEQYLPRTVQDTVPTTGPGSLLAILEKADLVTACFGLGLEPTSSTDPYGLRRSAMGILKIILERKINLSLDFLFGQCKSRKEVLPKLTTFFKDRLKALLVDRGFREDVVEAVLASGFDQPYASFMRVEALSRILKEDYFPKAWKVVERTVNILKGNREALPGRVDPALLAEDLEKEVFRRYEASSEGIRQAIQVQDFRRATSLYAEAFFDILGTFFEKVLVNVDNPLVRANRLVLMRIIKELYTQKIADLSKIRL